MIEKLMKIVSLVLHPLLMPTYTFALIFFYLPEVIKPLTIIMLPFLFITTFVIPLLSISMLRYSGSISNFTLDNVKERPMPFAFVAIFYGITTYMFIYKIHVNDAIAVMLITTTLLIILLTIITFKFKISIHAAGVSGVIGFLTYFGMYFPSFEIIYVIMAAIVTAGIAMSSRLYLQAHTPTQVLIGCGLGFLVSFCGLFFFA